MVYRQLCWRKLFSVSDPVFETGLPHKPNWTRLRTEEPAKPYEIELCSVLLNWPKSVKLTSLKSRSAQLTRNKFDWSFFVLSHQNNGQLHWSKPIVPHFSLAHAWVRVNFIDQNFADSLKSSSKIKFFMLSDSQVCIALFVSLLTGILAVRLGTQLYK